ncbi:DUF2953 domain-containing protein [Clostridium cellulovorans]|uniref:DUF2953 domain-containing protein n=1 Tax=Clostridium cellulovorans (strain ATCC 35296 / DSM 3052 / OCM 3 / 743B) TaxID=573061 RepID=D9SM59_CLOC7|nr:DUF2953 domain-containing protein [Clostridium cellulovorans]ADL51790.1 Protein of unknown function DUF2953 [Clostridium cellulovorans 743B]
MILKIFLYLLLFLIILFLLPIPVIIKGNFSKDAIEIHVYGKKISLNKKLKKANKDENLKETIETKKKKEKKNASKKKKAIMDRINENLSIPTVLKLHGKFKKVFTIRKLHMNFNYGLQDPYNTAMAYWSICSMHCIIYKFFEFLVHIKDYSFKIIPNFNKEEISFNFSCIFIINFAKITYIAFYAYKILISNSKINSRRDYYGRSSNKRFT